MTDIEIARSTKLEEIEAVASKYGIPTKELEHYGHYMAKVPTRLIDEERVKKSNLILVTAITPTKAGIGKTTVTIGLALGLTRIGKKAICALREPSLGPVFGLKGGACGGGHTQVLPMDKINLHFTGDFHAITAAHNLIAALLDNYIFRHQGEPCELKTVYWGRVLDVNDRALRKIVIGLGAGNGVVRESGFDISVASEIMAIHGRLAKCKAALIAQTIQGHGEAYAHRGLADASLRRRHGCHQYHIAAIHLAFVNTLQWYFGNVLSVMLQLVGGDTYRVSNLRNRLQHGLACNLNVTFHS